VRWIVPFLVGSALSVAAAQQGLASDQRGEGAPLWDFYNSVLSHAKYIDLTHAIAPGGPIGEGFVDFKVASAVAGVAIPGVIDKGEPFTYEKLGAAITAYELPMDHIGTQFGPPAHENDHGATISDIPPTVALRPLVVINVASKVVADPGYQATVADIKDWERRH
jgi:kynurenine formamidase